MTEERQVKLHSVSLEQSGLSVEQFETYAKLQSMTLPNNDTNKIAKLNGLDIVKISWEDNARDKNSSNGPHISDLTLNIGNYPMPIIRENNFIDKTWDIDINKIPIVVGNHKLKKSKLKRISLKQYLQNIGMFDFECSDHFIVFVCFMMFFDW